MTHKTFRDLTNYEREQRKKVAPFIQQISKLTMEEVILLQSALSHMMWYSIQQVEEKNIINQNTESDVEELV